MLGGLANMRMLGGYPGTCETNRGEAEWRAREKTGVGSVEKIYNQEYGANIHGADR